MNGCQSWAVTEKDSKRGQEQGQAVNELLGTDTITASLRSLRSLKLTKLFNFVGALISRQWNILHLPATFPVAQQKAP